MNEVFEIVESPHALRNELKLKSRKTQVWHRMASKQHLFLALESVTVYPVTLNNVNPLSFSSQRSKIGFLKTALANFVKLTSNESATCKFPIKYVFFMTVIFRSGSTCSVTSGI